MLWARRRLPRIGPQVHGSVESVRDYVTDELGEPHRYEELRPAQDVVRRPPATLGGDPLREPFATLQRHRHPAVFRAHLPHAHVAGGPAIVMTRDGRPLLQSGFNPDHVTANPLVGERLRLSWPARSRRLLVTQWDSNHFHWMFDSLPRLALLTDDPRAPLLVSAGLGEAQRTSLRLAGVGDTDLDEFHGYPVKARELEFPSLVGRTGHPPRWVLDWLREKLVPAPTRRGRRLFVSRRDATSRRLANEGEVFAALEPLGFELILPGRLPLAEQLRSFAEASVVVGPHGAGLVSLLAATDAVVVEMFDPRYVNPCYYAVAEALECPYWFVMGAPAGDDFTAEPQAVRATVEAATR
jgi:hypothetical protein